MFKVGDKVKYVNDIKNILGENYVLGNKIKIGIPYDLKEDKCNIGDIDAVTALCDNEYDYIALCMSLFGSYSNKPQEKIFPVIRFGNGGLAPAKCFELVSESAQKTCDCSAQRLLWGEHLCEAYKK